SGSFGTYPKQIREQFLRFQLASEARPDHFIRFDYPNYLDASRLAVSKLLNVDVDTIVFVPNATTGVNTVLRSLRYEPGDKIVYFNFIYGACGKTVHYIEETTPARGIKIDVDFPCEDDELVGAFKEAIVDAARRSGESRVRVAVFDSIVSLPGVRLPFEKLVQACRELGVYSLMDAAHGIGNISLDLGALNPDFFVSNCHKWLYVPRGCAAFYVPRHHQHLITSMPTSHGFIPSAPPAVNIPNPLPPSPTPKTPWIAMFEFVGTLDNSPYLCVPAAIAYRQHVLGGEAKIMSYCQALAQRGARIIAEMLDTDILDNATGTLGKCCLSNVRLPIGTTSPSRYVSAKEQDGSGAETYIVSARVAPNVVNYLHQTMVDEFKTFIPVILYRGNWYARLSGQVYLEEEDYVWGGKVLRELVKRVIAGKVPV
ncbi:putative aminotransferase, partial [Kalaharituber pfeilii]